ncbi:M24 family metallopeptidase [Chelatococcus asaccharovorans]|uniref:Xaa-Pro aminopeptidase n=1 Tax=Chelatococcus asaccharovorans TaxID=28210 RepID=A0A2V3U4N2_9HYPH|nr:Xaa-Pro peptidase family protein [Chelatococcus asaccharovorans]MBS7703743.1 aminopeptidase P family protein [Chelatococcus asaccharovorans]PXW57901.1 Xaa-Pro aminopeptidase [Chelatococcus asaccharovorans]
MIAPGEAFPVNSRLARLAARMEKVGTDIVVIGPSSHMQWLLGLSPHGDERPVMLIMSARRAGILMPALNADSSRVKTSLPFFTWTDEEGPHDALNALLEDVGAKRCGLTMAIDESMRADHALLVLDALPGIRRTFAANTVGALRAVKDAAEYAALVASACVNDAAMRAGFAALAVGVSELDVADAIRQAFIEHGAHPEFISVCFDGNGAFPHHYTGHSRLAPNGAVLIDIGARLDWYPSDMTRVATIGAAPRGFMDVHAVVDRAVRAALDAAVAGARARDVDRAARAVIEAAGYGPNFSHRTGHGMGFDLHEPPYIAATSDAVLTEGNVFSIEPGIYLPDRFGIRLEEIVIIRNGRAEILSSLPRTVHEAKS